MGFLDNLISKSTKKMISDLAKSAVDAVSEEWNKATGSETSRPVYAASGTSNDTMPAGYEAFADAMVIDKIKAVMQREFPQYEVREDVSPTTLGGTGRFLPYSLGIYENNVPKLFIMEIYNNTCASRYYRWSKEMAAKAGIPLINFVAHYPNRIEYIINRLHQYL